MNEVEPTSSAPAAPAPAPPASPGIFGTKIPSSVAFGIGVLLFFMPFLDIKCNNMTLQTVSGVQLATGFEIKSAGSDNSFFGGIDRMNDEQDKWNKTGKEKKDPNMFALAALVLGIIGFVLCLADKKGGLTGGVITGTLGAVALIATMIDLKRMIKMDIPELGNKSSSAGISDLDKLGDNMYIAVDFTPSFYIAIIAFASAAWLCYKRMQVGKSG